MQTHHLIITFLQKKISTIYKFSIECDFGTWHPNCVDDQDSNHCMN
jgi:hypothetical protein